MTKDRAWGHGLSLDGRGGQRTRCLAVWDEGLQVCGEDGVLGFRGLHHEPHLPAGKPELRGVLLGTLGAAGGAALLSLCACLVFW